MSQLKLTRVRFVVSITQGRGVWSAYTIPSPDPTCEITLGLLLLLLAEEMSTTHGMSEHLLQVPAFKYKTSDPKQFSF
uniref:Putative ovule protein n=1 Tax=Solanum chacoense TaxID=4108 RepID=A0A0V0GJX8_SOLCH